MAWRKPATARLHRDGAITRGRRWRQDYARAAARRGSGDHGDPDGGGLAAAHAGTVVHRDIKPSNVIITQTGVAKIVDFGLARLLPSSGSTQSISTAGTIGYMSPEQTIGKDRGPADRYLVAGHRAGGDGDGKNPLHRETAAATVFRDPQRASEPLDEAEVPIELLRIIYRALSKEPATRYGLAARCWQTCRSFAAISIRR